MKDLCDFISSNVKQEHFPYLRRNVYTMEDQLTAAQIDYRNVMPGGNPGELWLVESWSRDHSAHLWLAARCGGRHQGLAAEELRGRGPRQVNNQSQRGV